MRLLHVVATARQESSRTLVISQGLLKQLRRKLGDLHVETLDLFASDLPAIAGDNIEAKYTLMKGLKIDKSHEESWQEIEKLISQFLGADIVLVSVPMWNFSIPYALKYYIDCIVQPGYLFRYDEKGQPMGMVQGKKMIFVSTRGGDYSENSPFHVYDFQEPYLRAIFGFCGVSDMHFVRAQPLDITPEIRKIAMKNAMQAAKDLVNSFEFV
ncbi:MAG: NAD(P)H-dependent oxidoreductase [Anaerolineae bacterium]|nr:NAD(P)H-dependent oxidoreductase [Anaerolineae bacterium]MCB9459768.1 NAD(P)H-dependent oxidoreductase [Anaerolineaceae bacterium]